MPHEIDKVALSAHLDGRGTPETAAHVASCPECAAYLERIGRASALFRKHGAAPVKASQKPSSFRRAALVTAVVAAGVLVSGWALKHYMPGLLAQVQGMISGAANSLGR